jgi:peptidoglycan hydrolase-like protein with peptidoglycan-binding domain
MAGMSANPRSDFDHDGNIDGADLDLLVAGYQRAHCTPTAPATGGGGGGGVAPTTFYAPVSTSTGTVLGTSTGAVLGTSTAATTSCEVLTHYMKIGQQNDVHDVKLLQTFLNANLGLTIPVTGVFGPMTEAAVREFQLKYHLSVLSPWVALGLPNDMTSTGYVYKTTMWMINSLLCPTANIPAPVL